MRTKKKKKLESCQIKRKALRLFEDHGQRPAELIAEERINSLKDDPNARNWWIGVLNEIRNQ